MILEIIVLLLVPIWISLVFAVLIMRGLVVRYQERKGRENAR